MMQRSLNVFICYAHEDEFLLRRLENHLALLRNQGLIAPWHDRNITAGLEREREINVHLKTADIILLLISADFLASDYYRSSELEQALKRDKMGGVRVIPVLLRDVDLKDAPFSHLQALPKNTIPVTHPKWTNLDLAFADIARSIREVVEELTIGQSRPASSSPRPTATPKVMPMGLPRPTTLIGRDNELASLISQLRTGEACGICSLNGMGGVGKTAVAAEAVARLSQDHKAFPGGAAWISCEGLIGTEGLSEVWKRVAQAIGLEQVIVISDLEAQRTVLANTLARLPRLLLTLDNIEPQLDIRALLDTLIIPNHTTLLLTSRQVVIPERLVSIRLHPLSEIDARTLFIKRLKQVDETYLANEDHIEVQQIIAMLGGLPLAIELVAAYTGIQSLPLAQILEELKQDMIEATSLNFDSTRALSSRFNRSWAVLLPREQRLFAGLSLHKGTTFPRAAAIQLALAAMSDEEKKLIDMQATQRSTETVGGGSFASEPDLYERQAVRDVAKLVSYALVETLSGSTQLRLHPLLGDYAATRLREFSSVAVRKRMAQKFIGFLCRNPLIRMIIPKRVTTLSSDVDKQLRDAYSAYWHEYGQIHPSYQGKQAFEVERAWRAEEKFQAHLAARGDTSSSMRTLPAQAEGLGKIGFSIGIQGAQSLGRSRVLESLAINRAINNIEGIGRCYQYLALLDEADGNYSDAIKHWSEALRRFEEVQSPTVNVARAEMMRLQEKAKGFPVTKSQSKSLSRGLVHVERGKPAGRSYEIYKTLYIGRSHKADIILDDKDVSQMHAALLPLDKENYGLIDEGSAKGTWLHRIGSLKEHQLYPLQSGDTISIGENVLTFTLQKE